MQISRAHKTSVFQTLAFEMSFNAFSPGQKRRLRRPLHRQIQLILARRGHSKPIYRSLSDGQPKNVVLGTPNHERVKLQTCISRMFQGIVP